MWVILVTLESGIRSLGTLLALCIYTIQYWGNVDWISGQGTTYFVMVACPPHGKKSRISQFFLRTTILWVSYNTLSTPLDISGDPASPKFQPTPNGLNCSYPFTGLFLASASAHTLRALHATLHGRRPLTCQIHPSSPWSWVPICLFCFEHSPFARRPILDAV